MKNCIIKSAMALVSMVAVSSAAPIVTKTAGQINGLNTATTSYVDADFVVMTPLLGGTPTSFNGNATRLGIDRPGYVLKNTAALLGLPVGDPLIPFLTEANNNPDGFNDLDRTAGNANDESLLMAFTSDSGLAAFSWDFSRAQISISGFTSDPGATITGFLTGVTGPTYSAGVLTFGLSGAHFSGTITTLTLANAAASAGQTLHLKVNDPAQNGSQLAIRTMSYFVPEPATLASLAAAATLALRRRK
jgi:hypothetical protein